VNEIDCPAEGLGSAAEQADTGAVTPPPADPPEPRRPGTESVLTLAGGVLAGVGSVFSGTHSILATLIAVTAAVVLTAMVLTARR
jgi:hypothetical protein